MKHEEKRARRRRDLQRMKAKARKVYPHDARATGAEHLAMCSCRMCGNPRRHGEGDKFSDAKKRYVLEE